MNCAVCGCEEKKAKNLIVVTDRGICFSFFVCEKHYWKWLSLNPILERIRKTLFP